MPVKSNIKIIHWEYNEELFGKEDEKDNGVNIGLKHDSETDKPTSIYFVWRYLLLNNKNVCLHCACQNSVKIDEVISLFELQFIAGNSYKAFTEIFQDRLDLIGLSVEIEMADYRIPDVALLPLMEVLNSRFL